MLFVKHAKNAEAILMALGEVSFEFNVACRPPPTGGSGTAEGFQVAESSGEAARRGSLGRL